MSTANHVRIAKDSLSFCAAHFITLAGGECESLHGHDYRVAVEVHGPLGDQQYVVDFVAVEKCVRQRIEQWDHRVLLPEANPEIQVARNGAEVTVRFGARRWAFPAEDCCVLPVTNTTSEALAGLIAEDLSRCLATLLSASLIRVEIHESCGFVAVCDLRPE